MDVTSPFSPIAPNQFDVYKAAHLLWRAGFGGTWEEVEKLHKLGLEGAVASLVSISSEKSEVPKALSQPAETDAEYNARVKGLSERERNEEQNKRAAAEGEKITDLRFWWLHRMLTTPRPLEEKLTLFWHSHFASSFADKIERAFPMWQQNEMFRQSALKPFPEMLKKLIRDPAMLVWLDNASSHKNRPNENFGRELLELFTLGIGNYTEADVKAAARALTGFSVDREKWSFLMNAGAHDTDEKAFLGQKGEWSGDDIVRIICEQKAMPEFMTGKFLDFFVHENAEPQIVAEAARIYREKKYDLAEFLTMLLQSQLFYSPRASASIVKSPVVLTVGALKSFRVPVPEKKVLIDALRLMGQDLFFPPDVNGWVGGTAWINSNMLLIRYNFSNFLLNGVSPDQFKTFDRKTAGSSAKRREFVESQREGKPIEWSPRAQLKELGVDRRLTTSADIVDYYIREFLQRPVSRELRQQFITFAETDASGGRRSFSLNDPNFDERVKGLVHLIMSSPDYQLC